MPRFSRAIIAVSAILSSAAFALCGGCVLVTTTGCMEAARYTAMLDFTVPYTTNAGLDVESDNGGVAVSKAVDTSQVHIIGKVRAATQERADAVKVRASRAEDGTLLVRVDWPNNKRLGNEGCEISISIADTKWLRLVTTNGGIKAANMSGVADLVSTNGSIKISDHAGAVNARTSNGAIEVRSIAGPVKAETTNGAIELLGVDQHATAETTNGSIEVALTPDSAGPVKLGSTNGNIKVVVGRGFAGEMLTQTSNGGIHGDVPQEVTVSGGKHEKRFGFGGKGSAAKSVATTRNGTVTVKVGGG